MAELNIEIICANSSHAKGSVEQVNRTLQDRLVSEVMAEGGRARTRSPGCDEAVSTMLTITAFRPL